MSRFFGFIALLAGLILPAVHLNAQIVDWTNSTSIDHHWTNVNNWSAGKVPTITETARFSLFGDYDIDFNGVATADIGRIEVFNGWAELVNSSGNQSILNVAETNSVRIDGSDARLILRSVSLNGNRIDLDDGGQLYVSDYVTNPVSTDVQLTGNIVNNGNLFIYNDATITANALFVGWGGFNPSGEATIRGNGAVGNFNGMRIGQDGIGELTVDHRGVVNTESLELGYSEGGVGIVNIDGFDSTINADDVLVGFRGDGHLTVQNRGTLNATWVAIGGTEDNTFGTAFVSGGTIQTDFLEVGRTFFGIAPLGPAEMTIDQGGQVIVANASNISSEATVNLNGGVFRFGTLEDYSLERIFATSGVLSGNVNYYGTSNFANLTQNISSSVDSSDLVITNKGGFLFGGGDFGHGIQNQGDVQVGPGERLVLRGNTIINNGRLTNHGGIVHFTNQFINEEFETDGPALLGGRGTFIAESWQNSSAMAFSAGATDILGDFENIGDGVVVTSGGGVTTFFDDVIHNGDEIRTSEGSQTVFFGAVSGAGAFKGDGTVFFEGDLRPGNSPDVISFEGNVVLGSSNRTKIELAGLNEGEFDKLLIEGDFRINGELQVDIIDGHFISSNELYLIAEIDGNLEGQFDGLDEGAFVGNFNGHDLFISYQAGDGNDVALFSSVPEPSCGVLLIFATAGFLLRRRQQTRR